MKFRLLFIIGLLACSSLFAQQVARNMVVLEIGTGTWCTYCPGAAMGAHDLIANGKDVAVIKYHSGDSYANAASAARISYYNITGFPTSYFDGTLNYVGGSNTVSLYPQFLPMYNQRKAINSSFTIDVAGTNTGNTYTVTLSVKKVAAYTGTNLIVHLALTESNIAFPWQGQTHVHNAQRLMAPSQSGSPLSFTSGDMQIINLTFDKNPAWVTNNCELVAFVQDNSTKEILQGSKVALNALPTPLTVNFTSSSTSFCAPNSVNFTDQSTSATNWKWEFPGGTPSTSSVQNPSVTYSTPGNHDVTLTAWNSTRGNKVIKPAYIQVNSSPTAPGTPTGTAGFCVNPPNATYTTTGSTTATSYEWLLTPAAAGVVSPSGTSCSINWSDTYTGSAQVSVRGQNSCGFSTYSLPINVNINTAPGQPTAPTGPSSLCKNPLDSEYSTTGTTNVTDYIWEIMPYNAGYINPNWTLATVYWDDNFTGTATIRVRGVNGGCEGTWSESKSVIINPIPQVFNVTGGGSYCEGQTGLPVGLDNSENGTNYTLFLSGTATTNILPGNGSALSFGNQTPAGEYTVTGILNANTCQSNMQGNANITLKTVPAAPTQPAGPVTIYSLSTPSTTYSIGSVATAASYDWELTPASAGSLVNNGTNATITWDAIYLGNISLKAKAVNDCGASVYSESIQVNVFNTVGMPELPSDGCIIYPNPASGYFVIKSETNFISDVCLIDGLGKIVNNFGNIQINKNTKLDINDINHGIYQLRLTTDKGVKTFRLIVK